MEKERFWFGMALIALPMSFLCLPFLDSGPIVEDIRTEPFEGRVSVHGRPLTHGFIVFYPEDESSDAAASYIDEDGHFRIGPRWLRHRAKQTPYRICVLPTRRDRFGNELPALEGRSSGRPGTIPPPQVERLSNPRTTNLKVHLGAQAAEVDVDL